MEFTVMASWSAKGGVLIGDKGFAEFILLKDKSRDIPGRLHFRIA